MINSLDETSDKIIEQLIEEAEKELSVNEEYNKIRMKYNKLFHSIKNLLSKEYQDLMFELDRELGMIQYLKMEHAYKNGFKKGSENRDE